MFQLGGIAGYLFTPLAEAVVFALLGSFILSRTLVPTLANYLLRAHQGGHGDPEHGGHAPQARSRNPLTRFQQGFEKVFGQVRDRYRSLLSLALARPKTFIAGFLVCVLLSFGLFPFLGQNFFPSVDAGQILMHVRAQPGTRIEETAREFDLVEQVVRQTIPPEQLDNIVDNIGLPYSGINMAYQNTGTIGPEDGDALISLKEDHAPTAEYVQKLRTILPQKFPGVTFSFLPADIVSQILNFGLPAPIDLQVIGNDQKDNYAYATALLKRVRTVPGVADARIQQVVDYPQLNVQVDRTLASEVGLNSARRRQQPARHVVGQRPGEAQFLAEYEDGRLLPDRRPDASVPYRYPVGLDQHADHVAADKDAAISGRRGKRDPRTESRRGLALQRATHDRHFRRDPRARSRRDFGRHR